MRTPTLLLAAMLLTGGATGSVAAQTTELVARSENGTQVQAVRIGDPDKPAVVVIAGVQGHHTVGVSVAERIAGLIEQNHPGALERACLYVIPRLNPDGAAWLSGDAGPMVESGRAPGEFDRDGDGRVNEDGPNDLNGDGMITLMRVRDPGPRSGLRPTLVRHHEDDRLMREPVASDGEVARYAVLVEGTDDDGDGAFNEDAGGAGSGGTDFDKNFPSFYEEHSDGAGVWPLSRPETRGLAEWLQSKPRVMAVFVLGPNDTIMTKPDTRARDATGRMPRELLERDQAAFDMIAEAYKEAADRPAGQKGELAGSLLSWLYSDLGVLAFGDPLYTAPPKAEQAEREAEASEEDNAEPPEAAATVSSAEARTRGEAQRLREMGVAERFVEFLTATAEEQQAMMMESQASSEEERAALVEEMNALPAAVRNRVMAIASGQPDPGMPETEAEEAAERPARRGKQRGKADAAEQAWLAHADRVGEGFVAWEPFDHPQLGEVEIGGFVPGFRVNPPAEKIETLAEERAEFIAAVMNMAPALQFSAPRIEALGGGLYRVTLSIRNTGVLPSVSSAGLLTGTVPSTVVRIGVEPEAMIEGRLTSNTGKIEGGDRWVEQWVVLGEPGETLRIEIRDQRFGDRTLEAAFPEARSSGGER